MERERSGTELSSIVGIESDGSRRLVVSKYVLGGIAGDRTSTSNGGHAAMSAVTHRL